MTGKDPATAYDLLHKAGLKVSIDDSFVYLNGSYLGVHPGYQVAVNHQQPRAGDVVQRGTNVSTSLTEIEILPTGDRAWAPPRCSVLKKEIPDLTGMSLSGAFGYWGASCRPTLSVLLRAPLTSATGKHLLDNYVVMYQSPAAGAPLPSDCNVWSLYPPSFQAWAGICLIGLEAATPARSAAIRKRKAERRQAAIVLVFKTDGQPWSGQPFPTSEAIRDCSITTGRASAGLSVKGRCSTSAQIMADHSIQVKLHETWPSTSFYVQICTNKTGGSCFVPPAFSYSDSTAVRDGVKWVFSNSLFVRVCGDYAGSSRSCASPARSGKRLSYTYTYAVTRDGQIEDPPGWGDFPPQFVH